MSTALEAAKWVCAALLVITLIATAPLWGIPYMLYQLFGPMVKDMKRVLDGRMKFW
jgi:hypothetical protein